MSDTQTKSIYFSTTRREAKNKFSHALQKRLAEIDSRPIIFLCIGSDRATGDSLGPLVGQKLADRLHQPFLITHSRNDKKTAVYGTLHQTVHAGNLVNTLADINNRYKHPYIIAIDASLGIPEHIGYVTLGNGSLRPGIGVSHVLPEAGDIHITGIVNHSGKNNHVTLQTTKLLTVIELASFIADGILDALHVSTTLQRPQKSHFINIF